MTLEEKKKISKSRYEYWFLVAFIIGSMFILPFSIDAYESNFNKTWTATLIFFGSFTAISLLVGIINFIIYKKLDKKTIIWIYWW